MSSKNKTDEQDKSLSKDKKCSRSPNSIGTRNDEKGIYEGGLFSSTIEHGFGIMKYTDGTIYEGMWVNSKHWGKGRLLKPNGDHIEGAFFESDIIDATLNYANGDVYKGNLSQELPNGYGILNKQSIGEISAYFKNGEIVGEVKIRFTNGAKYTGTWVNGLMDGNGRLEYTDGSLFEGEFRNSEIGLSGKLSYVNGNIFEGAFHLGKPRRGRMNYVNGDVYYGKLHNDLKVSFGIYEWASGNNFIGLFYEGNWDTGMLTTKDGNKREVIWQDETFIDVDIFQ